MNERAIRELEQMYMMLSEEKKKAIDEAIKALQAQADVDIITALCSLPKIQSSDGQEYVQLADVLETVRRSQADGEYINRILKRMLAWRSKNTQSIDKVAMEMILRDELPSVAIPSKNTETQGDERWRLTFGQSVAIPNKTGEWLFKEVTEDYHVIGQCSKCKERRRIDNYCSNCGSYNGD